jgi:hypothetical protein
VFSALVKYMDCGGSGGARPQACIATTSKELALAADVIG